MAQTVLVIFSAWAFFVASEQSRQAPGISVPPGTSVADARELVMRPLQHARAPEVAEIIRQTVPNAIAFVDSRSNSVILSASHEVLARVDTLLVQLDVPRTSREDARLLMFTIRHRDAGDVAKQINEALGRTGAVRAAADAARSTVIVNSGGESTDHVASIIKQLDTPPQIVRLEFALLYAATAEQASDNENTLADNASPITPDLADVAKELGRFGAVRLLGRLTTVASEHQDFSVEGTIGRGLRVQLQGQVKHAMPSGTVDMDLVTRMTFVPSSKTDSHAQQDLFRLATAVAVPRGDTVVLGTAPTGWKPGESAILVVRVAP